MLKNDLFTHIKQFINLNQNKIMVGLRIFLIGFIVLLEWILNNRIFALFIILFSFIVQFIYNKRYFIFIFLAILVFFLFNTSAFDHLTLIKRIDTPFFQHPKTMMSTLFTPNSGREVLPDRVQYMLTIMQENQIKNYKLSDEISNDSQVLQRIVESAWPAKLEDTSTYSFITPNEEMNYQNCVTIAQVEDVILVNCH